MPVSVPEKASFQVTAELPDGTVEPLVWIQNYKPQFAHPFLLRSPLAFPTGTVIRGVPEEAKIGLAAVPHEAGAARRGARAADRQK